MRSAILFVVLLLVGCGRTDVLDDTPQDSVPQPVMACTSTCAHSPPGIDTPMHTTSSGRPLHWATCSCVRVSFDATLSPSDALMLRAAVKDWQSAAGATLCLTVDTQSSPRLTGSDRQRIHVMRLDPKNASPKISTTTFDEASGRLLNAVVEIGNEFPVDRQLVHGLGRALGLASGRDFVSALTPYPSGLTVPGPADVNSLRAMYGAKPWCTP
jgi:hypothetical protein